jgi:hypothetical protein
VKEDLYMEDSKYGVPTTAVMYITQRSPVVCFYFFLFLCLFVCLFVCLFFFLNFIDLIVSSDLNFCVCVIAYVVCSRWLV